MVSGVAGDSDHEDCTLKGENINQRQFMCQIALDERSWKSIEDGESPFFGRLPVAEPALSGCLNPRHLIVTSTDRHVSRCSQRPLPHANGGSWVTSNLHLEDTSPGPRHQQ